MEDKRSNPLADTLNLTLALSHELYPLVLKCFISEKLGHMNIILVFQDQNAMLLSYHIIHFTIYGHDCTIINLTVNLQNIHFANPFLITVFLSCSVSGKFPSFYTPLKLSFVYVLKPPWTLTINMINLLWVVNNVMYLLPLKSLLLSSVAACWEVQWRHVTDVVTS